MDRLVVDASVAIKWVVEEEGSEAAAGLLDGSTLAAPDFLIPECANILWKKVRRGELAPEGKPRSRPSSCSAPRSSWCRPGP